MSPRRASAYEVLRMGTAERIEELKLDPDRNPDEVRRVIADVVSGYQRGAHTGRSVPLRDPNEMERRLWESVAGYGPLTDLVADPFIEEIFIEGDRVTYIDGSGRLRALVAATTEEENRQVIDRLLSGTNRRLDASNAIEQARVLDGNARLTAVVPPVSDRLSVTVRKYTVTDETLQSLVERRALSAEAAAFLWLAAQASLSVLISGATGAGKTTLLSAWLRSIPDDQCIRICEEVREIHVPLPAHSSCYEASPVTLEGQRRYTLRDLVKVCLAQRVDLLCVGEVRGAEAFELTRAVNAGCGFACTVHANSARDALSAIVNAAIMAGENVPEPAVRKIFAQSIDFVVHLDRDLRRPRDGDEGLRRQVREILAIAPSMASDDFTTEPIFHRRALGEPILWTGAMPPEQVTELMERALPPDVRLKDLLSGDWRPEV